MYIYIFVYLCLYVQSIYIYLYILNIFIYIFIYIYICIKLLNLFGDASMTLVSCCPTKADFESDFWVEPGGGCEIIKAPPHRPAAGARLILCSGHGGEGEGVLSFVLFA